jgi:hypothetical protein
MPDAGSAIHAKSASYRLARSTRLSATTISAYDPSVRSPKLAKDRSHDWYRYYAGYSPGFVEDVLSLLEVGADALVWTRGTDRARRPQSRSRRGFRHSATT